MPFRGPKEFEEIMSKFFGKVKTWTDSNETYILALCEK